jgi:hypothetical protein
VKANNTAFREKRELVPELGVRKDFMNKQKATPRKDNDERK